MWRAFRRSEKDECSQTRDLLSGYMDRCLNPEEVAHVEGHLRTCSGCREELESLRATVALLHRLPEVAPSRSFVVAPVRPLPGRRALPALRFATAGVVLLLVLAFVVDLTNVVERKGQTELYFGSATIPEEDEAYWLVSGVRNSFSPKSETPVDLVVPDQTDNVYVAVDSLAADGVVYGAVESVPDEEVPQLVLMEGESEAVTRGEAGEFAVVSASGAKQSPFATNSAEVTSDLDSIMEGQDGPFLNMVPVGSDNNVLYSFDLNGAQREVKAAGDNDWLRSLEYGLIGLAVVLGGAAAALWLRQRRQRAEEVSKSKN